MSEELSKNLLCVLLGVGAWEGVSTRHGLYGLDPLVLAGRLSKKDNHQLCRCFSKQNDSSPALYQVLQKNRVRRCVTWRPILIWLSMTLCLGHLIAIIDTYRAPFAQEV